MFFSFQVPPGDLYEWLCLSQGEAAADQEEKLLPSRSYTTIPTTTARDLLLASSTHILVFLYIRGCKRTYFSKTETESIFVWETCFKPIFSQILPVIPDMYYLVLFPLVMWQCSNDFEMANNQISSFKRVQFCLHLTMSMMQLIAICVTIKALFILKHVQFCLNLTLNNIFNFINKHNLFIVVTVRITARS